MRDKMKQKLSKFFSQSNFYIYKKFTLKILLILILTAFNSIADDVVVEVLISTEDNKTWQPKKSMHLTLAHIKNVEGAEIQKTIEDFNIRNEDLLKKTLSDGFVVEKLNINGFGKGYHILEADGNTFKQLAKLNDSLYQYLDNSYNVDFTNITSPRYIYATGYIPHIEFIESAADKIPSSKTILKFISLKLYVRILNFNRGGLKNSIKK